MQLYWGVHACLRPQVDDSERMIQNTMKAAADTGAAELSDKLILVAGLPLKCPHLVNTVRVLILGTVLARSSSGGFANPGITRAQDRIIHAATPDDVRDRKVSRDDEILVCKELTEDYTPLIRRVTGLICEGVSEINEERLRFINPRLVWLTNIADAAKKLE